MTLAEAALAYHDAGLTVIPLSPGSKKGTISWGQYQRVRPTREQVVSWWSESPQSNIAVVTGALSGVVVVDVDSYAGASAAPWDALGTLVTRSCSGGSHYWFRHPGHPIKSVAEPNRAQYPHVDVRSDGGYIVMGPSQAPDKRTKGDFGSYQLVTPGVHVLSLPLFTPEIEHMLFPVSVRPPVGRSVPEGSPSGTAPGSTPGTDANWISAALSRTEVGSQRQAITRLAGYFAKQRIPLDVAQAVIRTAVFRWPIGDTKHPWNLHEINSCVASIYDKEGAGPTRIDATTPGLRVWTFSEYMREFSGAGTTWLVEDWLPAGGVGLVVAPPQTYKTWLLLDLALSVATGEPFLSRYPVHTPGPVLYVQAEDPPAVLADRLGALALAKLRRNRPFVGGEHIDPEELDTPVVDRPPAVTLSSGEGLNLKASGRANLRAQVERLRPALVILDPLYAFAGALDGYYSEVPGFMAFLKQLRAEYGTSFLIAHHTKKMNKEVGDAGREQTWGSNLMSAASEVDWQIRRLGAHAVTVQRHFKVAGGVEKTPFGVDIDDCRIPPLEVRELSAAEVEEALSIKQKDHDAAVSAGRARGTAKNAERGAETRSLVLRAASHAGISRTAGEIAALTGLARPTVNRALTDLAQEGRVTKAGRGKLTVWTATLINVKEVS